MPSPAPSVVKPSARRSSKSEWVRDPNAGHRTLDTYFKDMGDLNVMSPEEEMAAAANIFRLRGERWKAIFDYPPFTDGICAFVIARDEEKKVPGAAIAALCKAARRLRDRETREHKEAFDACVAAAAEAMADADPEGIIADSLCADLEGLAGGMRRGLSLDVKPPPRGSQRFRQYLAGIRRGALTLQAARNRFVQANLRLVVTMARRFNHGRMPLPDLIQEGNIGLMKAVDRFDHRRGFRFSTYGSWWIRHAITRALANKARAVRLPVHMLEVHGRIVRARNDFEAKHGRAPSIEEISAATQVPAHKIRQMHRYLIDEGPSLDASLGGEDDDRSVADLLADPTTENPGDTLDAELIEAGVQAALRDLRPIEADILRQRFGLADDEPKTLREIGDQYRLSRERIRQLQEQALAKIRSELDRRCLI